MSGYLNHFAKHLRLCILRLLADAPGCTANASILRSASADLGCAGTRDQVNTELGWLAEQGLITTRNVGELIVATITARGEDVAKGLARVEGVERPTPRG